MGRELSRLLNNSKTVADLLAERILWRGHRPARHVLVTLGTKPDGTGKSRKKCELGKKIESGSVGLKELEALMLKKSNAQVQRSGRARVEPR